MHMCDNKNNDKNKKKHRKNMSNNNNRIECKKDHHSRERYVRMLLFFPFPTFFYNKKKMWNAWQKVTFLTTSGKKKIKEMCTKKLFIFFWHLYLSMQPRFPFMPSCGATTAVYTSYRKLIKIYFYHFFRSILHFTL